MAADVSSFVYFSPVLVFLAVFAIMTALLHKTKLLNDRLPLNIFVSFVIATIFISASSATKLLLNVIPWFAVLIIALFLIMLLVANIKGGDAMVSKGIGWVFVILLIIVFLVSGIKVFAHTLAPYWPSATYDDVSQGDPQLVNFFAWLYSPKVKGFFLLIGTAALVTWFLMKYSGMAGKK